MYHNKILVTAIGSFSAMSVIDTLRRTGCYVVGCDIYPEEWHAESTHCHRFYQAPFATMRDEYISFLLDISNKENIDIILPLTDLEIDVLNANRITFEANNIKIAMPSEYALDIARNKYRIHTHFINDDIVPSVPTIRFNKDINPEAIVPCIAKPIDGRSSEGLLRINTPEEWNATLLNDKYIIQQKIEGNIVTVDYVRNSRTGHDFSIAREELLRTKNGAGITVRIFHSEELSDIVSHIGKQLNLNGAVNMEFILNDSRYYLIDINPRFSAGVAFSLTAGYDMVTSCINCHTGKDILPPVYVREQIMVKSYHETITKFI